MGKKRSTDDFPAFKDGVEFDALSTEDKEKVARYYEQGRHRSELRPLTPAERKTVRAEQRAARGKIGRPRIGQGAKVVAVTLEKGFLQEVDAYAKTHAMKRAEMITRGLRLVMGKSA